MPILRNLTTKIKTAISPSTSPTTSPTRSQTSGFEVVSGRREGGMIVKRPETNERMDSFMTNSTSNASQESVDWSQRKTRRISRFREELGAGDE
ncbi:hypothetical protein EK21DRAFT_62300 [Setomelanomma holmii]|uniref:Uncharacterized protein n=1 Tax=Setomelanomma holmii TaxID=210430 RepID=A0A9P4HE23_9PLEO|nr:hypothetical protein EK21DRAFT_62300 [Setomelanomma holmii]